MQPRVLLLDNQPQVSTYPGHLCSLKEFHQSGSIGAVARMSWRSLGNNRDQGVQLLLRMLKDFKPNVIIVQSPSQFPETADAFEALISALVGVIVVYWEGDAWGASKRQTPQMGWWCSRADLVFSVAGYPQVASLLTGGAREVHQTIHTYDHVLYAEQEQTFSADFEYDVVFVGNNLARIPIITGLPGSLGRWRLVGKLRATHGRNFLLQGSGWPKILSAGRSPLDQLGTIIQKGRVLANWDHFPGMTDYASDRLAVGLIAGRPQVTTRHPGMEWAPSDELGLFQQASPSSVADQVQALLSESLSVTTALGQEGWRWARGRLSHREALRFMLHRAGLPISPPPDDPWQVLRSYRNPT